MSTSGLPQTPQPTTGSVLFTFSVGGYPSTSSLPLTPFGSVSSTPIDFSSFKPHAAMKELVVFDPDGDLFLIFEGHPKKEEKVEFGKSSQPITLLPNPKIHMQVSSKHMTLASPVFKAMLRKDTFKEGHDLSATGRLEVPLPEDDPTSFTLLLNIIHGRSGNIPRKIDFPMMLKIAMLVDKYEMRDTIEFFSELWLDSLWPRSTPLTISDALPWIAVSWVFKRLEIFTEVTKYMIWNSDMGFGEVLQAQNLPIPRQLLDSIQGSRERGIRDMLQIIDDLVMRYRLPGRICTEAEHCDVQVLGSLIKGATLADGQMLWPLPSRPYCNMTLRGISDKIMAIRIHHCQPISGGGTSKKCASEHSIKNFIGPSVKRISDATLGLKWTIVADRGLSFDTSL